MSLKWQGLNHTAPECCVPKCTLSLSLSKPSCGGSRRRFTFRKSQIRACLIQAVELLICLNFYRRCQANRLHCFRTKKCVHLSSRNRCGKLHKKLKQSELQSSGFLASLVSFWLHSGRLRGRAAPFRHCPRRKTPYTPFAPLLSPCLVCFHGLC